MPKRTDIQSILLIGAGPIIIGQACEFDYSGTQAIKALKEEGYRVILVNSNPATIMTDPELADATYIEPITPEIVEKIIAKEKPDALLPTMGGQTALNTALALSQSGALKRYGVELIGATEDAIDKAESRTRFMAAMEKIGLECPKSFTCKTVEDALAGLDHVGLPAIIRPSFTMGGTGGGVAYNREEYIQIVSNGLEASPTTEVLIDESIIGWKEYEMEVVRDKNDNCIIVCAIENVDPMGVHTGDSITVAPALTLSDKEYQIMRTASIAVLREIGVETGGSNVQWAVNPKDGRLVIIEMNPRVSRSSALASKATGFPIAKVAAKLAVGYTLDEISNDITGVTPASFEPSIDYVVTKIPRFTFEKFAEAEPVLSTAMKSVGEAMAIGRNFQESLQKALASLETGLTGLNDIALPVDDAGIAADLAVARPDRLLRIAAALRRGKSIDFVAKASGYEAWFLRQIQDLVTTEKQIETHGLPLDKAGFTALKQKGFSDARLAELIKETEKNVRDKREFLNVRPVYKSIDTCAAEFAASTPYLYSSYETASGDLTPVSDAPPTDRQKIMILGGGPNRIGQGIEFDYCCCHAAFALTGQGYETIMVNCNPETVSTDYDTSDRLYFEPLTAEKVIDIARREQQAGQLVGVIVQFGGQTPLKLAHALEEAGIPILGTSPDAIDLAEDRERFQKIVQSLDLLQPANGLARSKEDALEIAEKVGYPVLIRPSYVLGGRAMEIVHDEASLVRYIDEAVNVSGDSPVLIDGFLDHAIEVDVDALCDGDKVHVAGIMEHIEEAGVHSGDSACTLPPYSLPLPILQEIERQTEILAKALKVVGLMNIQFAVKDGKIYLIEVNPRASRTIPFVAKAVGSPIAHIAARIMAGEKLDSFDLKSPVTRHMSVKEVVIPFGRFPGVDVLLGPEMKSTGEVMGIDRDFSRAFMKSQLGAGTILPKEGQVFLSVRQADKHGLVPVARDLIALGFTLIATDGTANYLEQHGLTVKKVYKVLENRRPNVLDIMINGDVQLMINTTDGQQAIFDSRELRQMALRKKVPYFTTLAAGRAAVTALTALQGKELDVTRLQDYAS